MVNPALSRSGPNAPVASAASVIGTADSLRRNGQAAQAAAVLENALIGGTPTRPLLLSYAKALAAAGRTAQALNVIDQAIDPANPDWQALMVKATLLDESGNGAGARTLYSQTLKLAPDQPSLHANLGLSYAAAGALDRAEAELQRAAALPGAGPDVRQNLALIIGLRGRLREAEVLLAADLPPEQVAQNLSFIRRIRADGRLNKG
jgi:Flp pilus assembly protein TadD